MSQPHFLSDMLSSWGQVNIKPMFGGLGAWKNGVFFALIVDETIYFKTDDRNRPAFVAAKSNAFSYARSGQTGETKIIIINSLWRIPDEVLEDAHALPLWAQYAYDAGLKSGHKPTQLKSPLPEFKTLRARSKSMLKAAGITNRKHIEKCGAVDAFKRVRKQFPRMASLDLLWELYGLLNGVDIYDVSADIKAHLLELLNAP